MDSNFHSGGIRLRKRRRTGRRRLESCRLLTGFLADSQHPVTAVIIRTLLAVDRDRQRCRSRFLLLLLLLRIVVGSSSFGHIALNGFGSDERVARVPTSGEWWRPLLPVVRCLSVAASLPSAAACRPSLDAIGKRLPPQCTCCAKYRSDADRCSDC